VEHPIEHSGIVQAVADGCVRVRITARGACGTCRAREACGMGESAEKIVEVYTARSGEYAAGDSVVVGVARRMGVTAVLLAYALPFALLLAVLAGLTAAGAGEGAAALGALGAVALYYGGLCLLRGRIDRKIHFTINKQ